MTPARSGLPALRSRDEADADAGPELFQNVFWLNASSATES